MDTIIMVILMAISSDKGSDPTKPLLYDGKSITEWRAIITRPNYTMMSPPAAFPLRRRPDPASIPLLVELIKDKDPLIRGFALTCLGILGVKARPAVGVVIERLGDPDQSVQAAAADALGQIRPGRKAVMPLLRLVREKQSKVRLKAPLVNDMVALPSLVEDMQFQVRVRAALALMRMQQPVAEALTLLLDYITAKEVNDYGFTACEIIETLSRLRDRKARRPIAQSLRRISSSEVLFGDDLREAALAGLGRLGDCSDETLRCLRAAMKEKEPSIRIASAGSYWQLTGETRQVVKILVVALQDMDVSEYAATLQTVKLLESMSGPQQGVVEALTKRAKEHTNPEVRQRIRRALRSIRMKQLKRGGSRKR